MLRFIAKAKSAWMGSYIINQEMSAQCNAAGRFLRSYFSYHSNSSLCSRVVPIWYKHRQWLVLLFAKVDVFRSSNVPTFRLVLPYILYFYRKGQGIVLLEFISSTAKFHFFCTDLVNGEVFSVQHLSSMWWRHLFLWPRKEKIFLQKATTLTLRLLMSYIYGAPILDVSRSHTTTQHSR